MCACWANILTCHCSFSFDFFSEETFISRSEEYEQVNGKFTWKPAFKNDFIAAFQQKKKKKKKNDTSERLNTLNMKILNCENNNETDSCLSELTNLIGAISSLLLYKTKIKTNINSSEQATVTNKNTVHGALKAVNRKIMFFFFFFFLHLLNKYS